MIVQRDILLGCLETGLDFLKSLSNFAGLSTVELGLESSSALKLPGMFVNSQSFSFALTDLI